MATKISKLLNACHIPSRPISLQMCQWSQPTSRSYRTSLALNSSPRPGPSFPCVEAHATRESKILKSAIGNSNKDPSTSESGPEPAYSWPTPQEYKTFTHSTPFSLVYGGSLPSFDVAYETWGTLSPSKDNVILLHTGLSASSHAASNKQHPAEGWWEKFIGPGKALDTNQFFVICTNALGGCYGSTGPSSMNPVTGTHYGTDFPILSIFDMVRSQFRLLDHLGIERLYASVGSSMGGMQSLAAGWLHPNRVGKIVSISGTARTTPGSIAMRFAQRSGSYFIFSYKFDFNCYLQSLWRTQTGRTGFITMVSHLILE